MLEIEPLRDQHLVLRAGPVGTDPEALADQEGIDDEDPGDAHQLLSTDGRYTTPASPGRAATAPDRGSLGSVTR